MYVYTDSDGKRHLFVKFIADVAQKSSSDNYLKKIKKLRKFNEIYEETNDLACVGGWEVDLIKNTVTWTRVTKEIHGVPKKYKPCLETGINFYKEGENREKITTLFTKCMEQGESFDDEFIIITADGKEKWVRSMGKAEFENGVCIRVYGAFQDISNRKKHQLAREKAENRFTKVFENSSIGIVLVNHQSLFDLITNSKNGIQRSHWFLKDHRYLITANHPHLLIRSPHQIDGLARFSLKENRPFSYFPASFLDQPHD